ncbi:MAG: cytochrome c oxidase subunit 3 [Rhodospirillales bacterium]|nr:cytochrome c oxidase subunit 3 [Rhodospirillales bacterium]
MSSDTHDGPLYASSGLKQPYHLVDPSPWPIIGALFGALTLVGIIMVGNFNNYTLLVIGVLGVAFVMVMWWRDVIRESRTPGLHTPIVRLGLRYGMLFFITSEVMFFVAFFWAFFNFALFPEHVSFAKIAEWPPAGIHTDNPFSVPFLLTMILLLSGTTVTWAHHCLLERDRKGLITGLGLTILLGISFTLGQLYEYTHSPFPFHAGIYPSVFFLATGFHGFHVIVGTCFLTVCWFRAQKGHFSPERHFGFEAAAWYWHFVDVVWLFLFTCVYLWGASAVTVG